MSIFTAHNLLREVIEHDSHLLPVLNRFGIKLGFGDATIRQICESHNINNELFLAIINVYHNTTYFPTQKLLELDIKDIIHYLVESHRYYKSQIIPEIEQLLTDLVENEKSNKDIFLLLKKFFENFKDEFNKHIEDEETVIFPKIIELSLMDTGSKLKAEDRSLIEFVNIHSQLDDSILDIKNLLFRYLPPIDDVEKCNAFAIAILRFEKDLKDHGRIEDRVLYSKVKQFL